MTALAARTALAALALAGCAQLEPDVGRLTVGTCKDAATTSQTVSFASDIRPLISRGMGGCGCHLPTGAGQGPATQLIGLDLGSYASLREGGVNSGTQVIVAGSPCSSILYQKVDDAPPFGSRMPLNGPPYLTDDELRLVHDWIAQGARDN